MADANGDLISLYQTLQREGNSFIEDLRAYFTPETNTPEAYQGFRDRFNQTENLREKALLFVYLNRHGYNGLCRYNGKGGFNVPFGRYPKPYFPETEMRYFHEKSKNAVFIQQSYPETFALLEPGDVVYGDPPYAPLSRTANFTSYAATGFTMEDQRELARLARQAAESGISVLLSNHDTPDIRAAYHGAQCHPIAVQRFISCNGNNRGKAPEVLAHFPPKGIIHLPKKRRIKQAQGL